MRSASGCRARAFVERVVQDEGFLERYPYYAAVLARLTPVLDPSTETLALTLHDRRFYLHVNADYFVRHPEFARGILLHEVHHFVLGHLVHPKFFGAREPELMSLAMEMSANEFIEEALPDPIVWQAFARYGMEKGQSTLERYQKLLEAQAAGEAIRSPKNTSNVDEHPFEHDTPEAPAGGLEQVCRIVEAAIEDAGTVLPGKRARLAGTTPGRLVEQLGGTLRAPEVPIDWKTALRAFVARERAPMHTFARPNRRFQSSVGVIPGRIWTSRTTPRPTLLVAIDTSMSMGLDELEAVARELRPLAEHARLVIVECDTEIRRVQPFDGQLRALEGRGGTDLRPVFSPALRAQWGAQGIICFTDGDGPLPAQAPEVPVLFVLTKEGPFDCAFGLRTELVTKAPKTAKPRSDVRRTARR